MIGYPIPVDGDYYRGSDPRRRRQANEYNRVAHRVRIHLNEAVSQWPDDHIGVFMSYQVAAALGENAELVRRIIMRIDGGSGGVTVCKGDYEKAMKR